MIPFGENVNHSLLEFDLILPTVLTADWGREVFLKKRITAGNLEAIAIHH